MPQTERDRRNRDRSVRRARGAVRRFIVANGCTFLWSLTFAVEPESPEAALAEGKAHVRRLRRRLGVALPYVLVVEVGSKGGRLHLHLAVDRYVPHSVMRAVWGKGHVWVTPPRVRAGQTAAQAVARYIAKYIGKDLGDGPGQAYRVAQGFQPERVVRLVDAPSDAVDLLAASGWVVDVLALHDFEDFAGPPTYVLLGRAPP